MSRAEGNEIARRFIPEYEDDLKSPPDGDRFQDLYDLETLEPHPRWQAAYEEVKAEAVAAGLPLR